MTITTYPKISQITTSAVKVLLVQFENGTRKQYDCTPLLQTEAFRPLEDETLFRLAHADPHGYGVIWNDEIDLAESEIWINGRTVEAG